MRSAGAAIYAVILLRRISAEAPRPLFRGPSWEDPVLTIHCKYAVIIARRPLTRGRRRVDPLGPPGRPKSRPRRGKKRRQKYVFLRSWSSGRSGARFWSLRDSHLRCFGAPGGSKSTPRRAPGGSKSSSGGSLEALGSLLAPLEGSLAVLLASRRAPGAGLEASWAQKRSQNASWAQMAPILGPFLGHVLGSPFGHIFHRFL